MLLRVRGEVGEGARAGARGQADRRRARRPGDALRQRPGASRRSWSGGRPAPPGAVHRLAGRDRARARRRPGSRRDRTASCCARRRSRASRSRSGTRTARSAAAAGRGARPSAGTRSTRRSASAACRSSARARADDARAGTRDGGLRRGPADEEVGARAPGRVHPVVVIPDFFHLVLVMNPGVAFGIFAGVPPRWRWIVSLFSLTALALLGSLAFRILPRGEHRGAPGHRARVRRRGRQPPRPLAVRGGGGLPRRLLARLPLAGVQRGRLGDHRRRVTPGRRAGVRAGRCPAADPADG